MYLKSPYSLPEGTLEYDIICSNNTITFEKIENIAPYEFVDRYFPNKHGVIFKEHIYAGDDLFSSFVISLVRGTKTFNPNNITSDIKRSDKKESILLQSNEVEINDLLDDELVRLNVELYDRDNNLIYSDSGYNSIIMKNIKFEGFPYIVPEVKNKDKSI